MIIDKEEFLSYCPCNTALHFVASHNYDLQEAWNHCVRPDWMVWLLKRTWLLPLEKTVSLSLVFAEFALERFKCSGFDDDPKLCTAVEAVKAWLADPTYDVTDAWMDAEYCYGHYINEIYSERNVCADDCSLVIFFTIDSIRSSQRHAMSLLYDIVSVTSSRLGWTGKMCCDVIREHLPTYIN